MSTYTIPETTTYRCDMCGSAMKPYSLELWKQVGFDVSFCNDCLTRFERLMALYTKNQVIIRNLEFKDKPPLEQSNKTFYLQPFYIGVPNAT